MTDHRSQHRSKSGRQRIVLISTVGIVALGIILVAAAFLLVSGKQRQAQIAALPTLALLASPTTPATNTPSDAPPSATVQAVIVVRVVTATPLPMSPTSTETATDPSTSTPVPTATPERSTSTSTPSATTILVQAQSVPPTLAPADPPTQAYISTSPQTYYVIVGSANLRSCARKDCAIVAPLLRNDAVTVVGYTQGDVVSGSNIWFAVHFGGYQGYVHSSLLGVNLIAPTAAPVYVAPTSVSNGISTLAPYVPPDTGSPGGGGFLCKDGTISHAAHRQGACSHHGGIA